MAFRVSLLQQEDLGCFSFFLAVFLLHWCLCCRTRAPRLLLSVLLSSYSTGVGLSEKSVSIASLSLTIILLHWCLGCPTRAPRMLLPALLLSYSTGVWFIRQEGLKCFSQFYHHPTSLVSGLSDRSA